MTDKWQQVFNDACIENNIKMGLLLNIDTATESAGVCLSLGGNILAMEETMGQKSHASFIQPAIQRVMQHAGYPLTAVDAIAVTAGPGSYTGLRVGLSTAKGLCYGLKKSLILVNTLEVMALAAIEAFGEKTGDVLFCPMIDARRMEVFTAIYTPALGVVSPPSAVILDENAFQEQLLLQKLVFSGSGSAKATYIQHRNALFSNALYNTKHLAALALLRFNAAKFNNLAYSEPQYLKEFYKKA